MLVVDDRRWTEEGWYTGPDPPVNMAAAAMAAPTKFPKDGLVVIAMMKDLGITDYEPRVVTQLLEFASRYVSCVLDDARAFAVHSKKKAIDMDDVRLAVMMQLDRVFTTPPPRDILLDVAREKNSIPLPVVKPHCGIRLPPDRYCFSSCNYRLKFNSAKKGDKNSINTGGSGLGGMKLSKGAATPLSVKRGPVMSSVQRTQNVSVSIQKPSNVRLPTETVVVNPASKSRVIGTQQVEVKIESEDSNSGHTSILSSTLAGHNKRKRMEDDIFMQS